jgi:hypothetical protein
VATTDDVLLAGRTGLGEAHSCLPGTARSLPDPSAAQRPSTEAAGRNVTLAIATIGKKEESMTKCWPFLP